MKFESLEDALLYDGLDDWVALGNAVGIAHEQTGSRDEAVAVPAALRAMTGLISDGLFEVGSVDGDGFHPWEPSPEGHVERLRAIVSKGNSLEWGFVAWFNLTTEGELRAMTIPHPED